MEGPSLYLAAELLAPFVGKKILSVEGNTKIGKERLINQKIISIFSYGKYLFIQFEGFALRVHFMLFGSFEAEVKGKKVTGDYPKKVRTPRLGMQLKNGQISMYSCSIHFIEESNAKEQCDYTIDTISDEWDEKKALRQTRKNPQEEIGDVLLDQTIFLGVGNIIKNEVLFITRISPLRRIEDISLKKLKEIIKVVREYVFQFYEWRKAFVLRKHYQIYKQRKCKVCGGEVIKIKTGKRNRRSFICHNCEK